MYQQRRNNYSNENYNNNYNGNYRNNNNNYNQNWDGNERGGYQQRQNYYEQDQEQYNSHYQQRGSYQQYNNNDNQFRNQRTNQSSQFNLRNKNQKVLWTNDEGTSDGFVIEEKEIISYLKRTRETLETSTFEESTERDQIIETALQEVMSENREDQFLVILNDSGLSKVIQNLVESSTEELFLQIVKRIIQSEKSFFSVAAGKYSSYILQSILQLCNDLSDQNEKNQLFEKICEYVKQDARYLLFNRNANFILRKLFEVIALLEDDGLFIELVNHFLTIQEPSKWVFSPVTSPLLSSLISTLHVEKEQQLEMFKQIVKSALNVDLDESIDKQQSFNKTKILNMCEDAKASHVLEAILKKMPAKYLNQFYTKIFKDCLLHLSSSVYGNHIVSFLLESASDKDVFASMFSELETKVSQIWKESNFKNVVVSLAHGCITFSTHQKAFMKAINEMYQGSFVEALLFDPKTNNSETNNYGCKLLYKMTSFDISLISPIIKYFKQVEQKTITQLSMDKHGSFVVEGLIEMFARTSSSSQNQFGAKFLGNCVKICNNPYGTRVIEKLIKKSSKNTIYGAAQELVKFEDTIKSSKFGIIVWNNCRLETFKRNPDYWADEQQRNEKVVEQFQDLMQGKVEKKSKQGKEAKGKEVKAKEAPKKKEQVAKKTQKEAEEEKEEEAVVVPKKENKKRKKLELVDTDFFNFEKPAKSDEDKRKTKKIKIEEDEEDAEEDISNILQSITKSKK